MSINQSINQKKPYQMIGPVPGNDLQILSERNKEKLNWELKNLLNLRTDSSLAIYERIFLTTPLKYYFSFPILSMSQFIVMFNNSMSIEFND